MENIKTINIPFFFGAQKDDNNGGKPKILPFKYYFNKTLKLYCQAGTQQLRNVLHDIYNEGSMLNGEMNVDDGGHQGKAALEFIYENFAQLKGAKTLEIGCGNGFILKQLEKKGAVCVGLEPGPQIEHARDNSKIELINDFFPSSKLTEKFDLILHFNVLEHLENPLLIIKEQQKLLNPGGRIIFGIPNCEPNLSTGDISIFMHEHYNYFTRDSLFYLAKHSGMRIDNVRPGASNGMIFCSLSIPDGSEESYYIDSNYNWEIFETKIQIALTNLNNTLAKYKINNVAIYSPKRALNALSILKIKNCRLVDDTVEMQNKYLPSFAKPIENINSLINNPPKLIIIFSRTFGEEILNKCRQNKELENTLILRIEEFD